MKITENKKTILKNGLIGTVIVLIALVFMFKSPLNLWQNGDTGTDSSVFRMIAVMMKNGYMPYRDSFDHKGPLLFIINYLGLLLCADHGLWFVELAFMIFNCFGIYKISRLCCNEFLSIIVILVSLQPLFLFFGGGNKAEEYAMPLIAWSLYIFIDYFKTETISKIRLLACGACCGATLMIQANMASMWVVFCIGVLVSTVANKQTEKLGFFLLYFCIGLLAVVLPIIIWLAANDSLIQFYKAYIGFNIIYTSFRDGGISISGQWAVAFSFLNKPVVLLSTICCILLIWYKKSLLNWLYLVYILFALWMASASGFFYEHYFMVIVPGIAYPIAEILGICSKKENRNASVLVAAALLLYAALPSWIDLLTWLPGEYNMRHSDHRSDIVRQVSEKIDDNTAPDEKILVYGNWDMFYLASNRLHATRYSYTVPILSLSKEMEEEYFKQVEEEKPGCIVVQMEFDDERIMNYISENDYKQIAFINVSQGEDVAIYLK